MHNANGSVDNKQLRSFGLIFAALLIVIFAGLLPWLTERAIPRWPFWTGVPVAVLGLVWPRGLLPLYRVWMKFGEVMGRINTFIILSVLFYLMVTPIGWLMRLFGKDPMRRQLDAAQQSYRVPSTGHDKAHMEKPY
ncbi:MAG: SxtJ family membrane protein [Spongiibacteraceae bacterium]|jgi:hypothetical protein|nr:SxtJ family membrane protein [Spongiibacteraceae bacterium]